MSELKSVGEFQIVDHGIEHSQYFQGCGVACTKYEYVVTGIGDNCEEALEDCLDQIMTDGFNTSSIENSEDIKQYKGAIARDQQSVSKHIHADADEWNYYLSIRWN